MILSIIIPAKNEEEQLPLLLASIRKQTFKDLEIIVADAKSTDKTREVAVSFGARVVEGGMPGPGRNRGAEAAKGEMLLFLDADATLPDQDFLKNSLEEMKRKNFCVAAPFYDFHGANTMDWVVSSLWNAWVSLASHFSPSATGSCIFAAKKVHDMVSGFNEKIILGEDTDYVYRASKHCRFGIIRSARAENSP
jgi:glycosyltransferase involved in cell wall biosynthesis